MAPALESPEVQSSLPEIPKKYTPGELAPSDGTRALDGYKTSQFATQHQQTVRNLVQQVAQMDQFARIDEVMRATEQRFYWRSMFEVYFNSKNMVWEFPGSGNDVDQGDIPLHYSFNIYQQFGKSFIKEVGVTPSVQMIATHPNDPDSVRISTAADSMRARIEYQNDMTTLARRVARLMWTDGRVGLHSRWVADGARFGYEEEPHSDEAIDGIGEGHPPKKKPRTPKGGARMSAWGVLELKLPINMREQADFPFIQLSYEIDLNSAKSMFPDIAINMSGGQPGPGEYNFDRTSRIAITQGTRLLTQTGDTVYQLPTYQRTWLRPSMFAAIDDEVERNFFQNAFPDGCVVTFIGETFAEIRNENMDDHWEILYPIDSDGQTTPSVGYIMMDPTDAFLDMTDLQMETYQKAIPAIYGNKDVVDFKAISKEKAGPGAHYPTKRALGGNEKMPDQFWAEPAVAFPEQAMVFYRQLLTDIPQSLTGLSAASVGDADPNNTTKGGIMSLQDASRRQQGMAWQAYRSAYARSIEKLIRIEAYFRESEAKDGFITISSPEKGEMLLDLEDLRPGSFFCVPDSDEQYPKTETDRKNDLVNLTTLAAAGSQTALAYIDANPQWIHQVLGEKDLIVPGADEADEQMEEIAQMLADPPVPIPGAMQMFQLATILAQATGKPAPPPPPDEKLFQPSVPIKYGDDDARHLQKWKQWKASPDGRRERRENPDGYMNTELHAKLHEARLQQTQQTAAQQAVLVQAGPKMLEAKAKAESKTDKSPTESIAFKDLGPSGRLQLAAQAGLDIKADVAGEMAEKLSAPPAPAEPPPA